MSVPEEIRKVKRPVNTVVTEGRGDGPKKYAVRERAGLTKDSDGKSRPKNGKVIGHIMDGVYVPLQNMPEQNIPETLVYGSHAFVHSVSGGLLDELEAVYPSSIAQKIMAISSMKAAMGDRRDEVLFSHYPMSWTSKYYPGLTFSEDEDFLSACSDWGWRVEFFKKRVSSLPLSHCVVIDVLQKRHREDCSFGTPFGQKTESGDFLIFAFDAEDGKPLCFETWPRRHMDAGAFSDFMRIFGLREACFVADGKWFTGSFRRALKNVPGLVILSEFGLGDKRVKEYGLLDFDGTFETPAEGKFLYAKRKISDGKTLISFSEPRSREEDFPENAEDMSAEGGAGGERDEKPSTSEWFVAYESDADMEPYKLCRMMEERETMRAMLNETGAVYDFDDRNDERLVSDGLIVNFVAGSLLCRMAKKAGDAHLLDEMTYNDLMDDLSSAWRLASAPDEAAEDDGFWARTEKEVMDEMTALGLVMPSESPSERLHKRGRPKTRPDSEDTPKRKRGRPKKVAPGDTPEA